MRLAMRLLLRALDGVTCWLPSVRKEPEHLKTGRRGEEEAYFYLRKQGYVIVARNWRAGGRRGELDLVGWDERTLCFIEVKTRGERGEVPAEAAVDMKKRDELVGMAGLYRRRVAAGTPFRFDVVSVYVGKKVEIELMKAAFEAR